MPLGFPAFPLFHPQHTLPHWHCDRVAKCIRYLSSVARPISLSPSQRDPTRTLSATLSPPVRPLTLARRTPSVPAGDEPWSATARRPAWDAGLPSRHLPRPSTGPAKHAGHATHIRHAASRLRRQPGTPSAPQTLPERRLSMHALVRGQRVALCSRDSASYNTARREL